MATPSKLSHRMRASSARIQEFQMRGRLGPYEILTPIGSGGMGEVYRARDPRLDRVVAIKVLKGSSLNSAHAVARFEREARAVAKLEHPHICPVYDVGNDDGVEFLVMQYLEGETLAARLRAGPLPIEDVLKYASQIARAIDEAHTNGITHRDLKPSNVMITKTGAKLLDFGLAKVDSSAVAGRAETDSTLSVDFTHPGTVLGTVRYMSPEALERRATDSRSDLFSLGAVLYEMVSGVRAFEADSDARAIAAILGSEPRRLRELRPETPAELESLIATCLAKNPDDRWQSARDVARQLDLIAGSRRVAPAIASPTQRFLRTQPRWMAAAAVICTVAAAVGVVAYMGWPAGAILEAPPHLVALPCDAEDAGERVLCDGLTEALIGRLVRLTQSHKIQVTPQLGGFGGTARTIDDARRALGATRVVQLNAVNDRSWTLTMSGERHDGVLTRQQLRLGDDGLFDLEERATAWIVRAMTLELTPIEREALTFRATNSEPARLWYLRGRGLYLMARNLKDFDAAINAFESSTHSDSLYAAAHVGRGMAWRGKYLHGRDATAGANARNACLQAVTLQPNLAQAHTCLGMLLAAERQLEQAASEFARAAEADPTDDDAIVWLGRTQEELHLAAQAEQTYERAITSRPHYYNPRVWQANFFRRQARYDDAAIALREAVELVSGNAGLHAALATPLMWTGRYDEALAAAERALGVSPSAEALVAQGMTLFRMGQYQRAVATIEQARTLLPSNPTVLASLGRAYYWWATPDARGKADGFFREAASLLEREALQPTGRLPKSDLRISLAECYAKLGRNDEAKSQLNLVGLNLDSPERPTDSHQLFYAALVYSQLGDREKAIKWLERAVFWGVPTAELKAWPELNTLRGDRAFQALIRVN